MVCSNVPPKNLPSCRCSNKHYTWLAPPKGQRIPQAWLRESAMPHSDTLRGAAKSAKSVATASVRTMSSSQKTPSVKTLRSQASSNKSKSGRSIRTPNVKTYKSQKSHGHALRNGPRAASSTDTVSVPTMTQKSGRKPRSAKTQAPTVSLRVEEEVDQNMREYRPDVMPFPRQHPKPKIRLQPQLTCLKVSRCGSARCVPKNLGFLRDQRPGTNSEKQNPII